MISHRHHWVSKHLVTAVRELRGNVHKSHIKLWLILLTVCVCVSACACSIQKGVPSTDPFTMVGSGRALHLISRKGLEWRWRWYSEGEREKPEKSTNLELGESSTVSISSKYKTVFLNYSPVASLPLKDSFINPLSILYDVHISMFS